MRFLCVESEIIAHWAPRFARQVARVAQMPRIENAEREGRLLRSRVLAYTNRSIRRSENGYQNIRPEELALLRQEALLSVASAGLSISSTRFHKDLDKWFGGDLSTPVLANALEGLNKSDAENLLRSVSQHDRYLRFVSAFLAPPALRGSNPKHHIHERISDLGRDVLNALDSDLYSSTIVKKLAEYVIETPRSQRTVDEVWQRVSQSFLDRMKQLLPEVYGGALPFVAISSHYSRRAAGVERGKDAEQHAWPTIYGEHLPYGSRVYGPYHWMSPGFEYLAKSAPAKGLWKHLLSVDRGALGEYRYLVHSRGEDSLGIVRAPPHRKLVDRVRSFFKR